jgi:hypothetical protein
MMSDYPVEDHIRGVVKDLLKTRGIAKTGLIKDINGTRKIPYIGLKNRLSLQVYRQMPSIIFIYFPFNNNLICSYSFLLFIISYVTNITTQILFLSCLIIIIS